MLENMLCVTSHAPTPDLQPPTLIRISDLYPFSMPTYAQVYVLYCPLILHYLHHCYHCQTVIRTAKFTLPRTSDQTIRQYFAIGAPWQPSCSFRFSLYKLGHSTLVTYFGYLVYLHIYLLTPLTQSLFDVISLLSSKYVICCPPTYDLQPPTYHLQPQPMTSNIPLPSPV